MQRRLADRLVLTFLLLALAGIPAFGDIIDFSATAPATKYVGSSLTPSGVPFLTITARDATGIGSGTNAFTAGSAAYVFWGNLGNLENAYTNCSPATSPCLGLGVVENSSLPINIGYEGIESARREALIFNFGAPFVKANSVKLTLVGLDNLSNPDFFRLYLDFAPVSGSANVTTVLLQGNINNPVVDFSLYSGIPDTFGAFAIRAEDGGRFGVGSISYTKAPEPGSMLLLGAGIAGLATLRSKKK